MLIPKIIIALVMSVLMAASTLSYVHEPDVGPDTDPAEEFGESDYDGAWARIEALEGEIFLPDGWTGGELDGDGACFRAQSPDGAVMLTVLCPVEDPSAGEAVSANGREARLIRGDDGSLTVLRELSEGRTAGFRFDRTDPSALSEEMALTIAGTWAEDW